MAAVAASGRRAFAFDMRGYGESDVPHLADAYTPFHCVGDLVAILDHFTIASAVLVGHDFGANAAWSAAMMRPDRFTAVFGISVPFRALGGPSFLDRLRASGADDFYMFSQMRTEAESAWADAADTIPGAYYWTSGEAPADTRWDPFDPSRGLLRPAPAPIRTIDLAYVDAAVASFSRTGFRGALSYYRAIDPFFELASRAYAGAVVAQPSFFLTGGRDGLNRVTRPDDASLQAALPNLRGSMTIEEAGHWPQLETADAVNATLLDFLASTAGSNGI
ncbi:alpha/beta fold hydrolase [Sphingomonas nostoxanthinifaciens]|uniref:alpha/beta fold hydrolase n=1 Tax=Sphingomonas nostoxanthinifaciens TaxID=2872652 RepID=UPI0021D8F2EE|nr:alpha/beta hydrolase [Sphingomonas nostoxanthinifaciens]